MNDERTIERCAQLIKTSRRAVVFTGAGVSTAAGLPDSRGPQGLYRRSDVDATRLFDIDAFGRDPSYYYRFHRLLRQTLSTIVPTVTHRFLARWEAAGGLAALVTQNFDGLHEAAGSKHVWTVHGTVATATCTLCGRAYTASQVDDLLEREEVPHCICGGVIKPDVVFFGEAVKFLDRAFAAAERADFMMVLGTSLTVAPACAIPSVCPAPVVIVNQGAVSTRGFRSSEIMAVDSDLDHFFGRLTEQVHFDR